MRLLTLSVPISEQNQMTTRALLISFLNHPEGSKIIWSYDIRTGYIDIKSRMLLLQSFKKRGDAPDILLVELHSLKSMSAGEAAAFIEFMEMPELLAYLPIQPEYNSRINTKEIDDLVRLMIAYRNDRSENELLRRIGFSFFHKLDWLKSLQLIYGDANPDYHSEAEKMLNPLLNRVSFDDLRNSGNPLLQ